MLSMKARHAVKGLVLYAFLLIVHGFEPMGGYTPVSDVIPHSRIALDICELETLVGRNDYTQASNVFANGLRAVKTDGTLRTLEAMAQKESTSPLWLQYVAFHGSALHLNSFLNDALEGTDAKWADNTAARQQAVKKGARDNIMPLYVIHELDTALERVQAGNLDDATGAPHAWDEAFAFYYGAQGEQQCGAPHNTVGDRANDFKTNAANGEARAHQSILAAFRSGLDAARTGNLAAATTARDEIVKQLRIPYLQATLKYAHKLDGDLATGSAEAGKHRAEALVFFRAVAAQVAQYTAEGASDLMDRFSTGNPTLAGNYEAAYCVIDRTLEGFQITWADIGQYPGTSPISDCSAYGAYTPVTNVDAQAKVTLDVCKLETLVGAGNFADARTVYQEGQNSPHKLADMAQATSSSPMWQKYHAFHSDAKHMHTLINSALAGGGKWQGKDDARAQVVKKGTRDLVLPMFIIHKLDSVLEGLAQTPPAVTAAGEWDEAYAFYTGLELECPSGKGGSPHDTAQDRAKDFSTITFGRPNVHRHIGAAFKDGLAATRAGDVEKARTARNEIVKQLVIPYLQGAIKYAHELDNDISSNNDDAVKHQAEAYVFLRAVAAQLADSDAAATTALLTRLDVATEPEEGNYIATYCLVEKALQPLGITWEDVGRYAGTRRVNCATGKLIEIEDDLEPCSTARVTLFTAQCSTQAAMAPLLVDTETNKDDLCGYKYDAVKCMHDHAMTFECSLPSFGIPTEEEKEEVYSDRRHLLDTESDPFIDGQLGLDDVAHLKCCDYYKDRKPKEEVYSDRRKLLGFPTGRELLAEEEECGEHCEESFCTSSDKDSKGNKYFSAPAMFILYRETLEAAIIVAVLLQFMDRTQNFELRRWVWIGAGSGVLVSIGMGVIFITIYFVTRDNLFSGDASYYFEGVVSIIASVMVSVLAFCMLRMWNMQAVWEKKLEDAMGEAFNGEDISKNPNDKGHQYTIFTLAFSAVFREGVETVVFLAGIGANTEPSAIPLAGAVGIFLGIFSSYLVFRGGGSMKTLKTLFQATFVVLLVIAAGVLMYGIHEIQEAGFFGTWKPKSERPWQNEALWDISGCCSHKTNDFFALMRALVGYTATPSFMEFFFYMIYWVMVLGLFYYRFKKGILTDKPVKGEEAVEKGLSETDLKAEEDGKPVEMTVNMLSEVNDRD
mmetsp:Transcript_28170/g.61715  ORF Transcript_28170/g.61715 Transcript_28170/m.61715 type:complete len:1182 (-) Transcript_28170:18-3563(-)